MACGRILVLKIFLECGAFVFLIARKYGVYTELRIYKVFLFYGASKILLDNFIVSKLKFKRVNNGLIKFMYLPRYNNKSA